MKIFNEEIVDLPKILAKRVIRYHGHHYIRVKWVRAYIDFTRRQTLQEVLDKAPVRKLADNDFYDKGFDDAISDFKQIITNLMR